jgi:hypothetical protein
MRRLLVTLCLLSSGAFSRAQAPAASQAQSPQFHEMQQVEDKWSAAVTGRDQYELELVLAPQYIGISASGDVSTRNQEIVHLLTGNNGLEKLEQKVVTVRIVGDVAIVNGTYVTTWKGDKGPVLEKGIFSHVFQHLRTSWVCINSQRTVVAEQVPEEKSKAKHSEGPSLHLPQIFKSPGSKSPPQ